MFHDDDLTAYITLRRIVPMPTENGRELQSPRFARWLEYLNPIFGVPGRFQEIAEGIHPWTLGTYTPFSWQRMHFTLTATPHEIVEEFLRIGFSPVSCRINDMVSTQHISQHTKTATPSHVMT